MQTPRPGPGRPPPRAGGGRRRRGRRQREPTPPPPGRPQTPRLAGTRGRLAPPGTGGGRRPVLGFPSARAVRPGRNHGGASEGRGLRCGETKEGGQAPRTLPTRGFLCLSHTRLCLQLSNLGTEEAGTLACWRGREGRLGPGSAPLSTPRVSGERVGWREGVMRVLKAPRCAKRFRTLSGFMSPRRRAIKLFLLWIGKLSHPCHSMLASKRPG